VLDDGVAAKQMLIEFDHRLILCFLEGRIKQARSPRFLHLATHGFVLPDQSSGTTNELSAGVEGLQRLSGVGMENPLLRSGLAATR
jgi:hypothetical protein